MILIVWSPGHTFENVIGYIYPESCIVDQAIVYISILGQIPNQNAFMRLVISTQSQNNKGYDSSLLPRVMSQGQSCLSIFS